VRGRATVLCSAFLCLSLSLACSGEPQTGPVDLAWDRDTCEHCYMTISDRRSAAQIRLHEGGPAHIFDELGCALLFVDAQAGPPGEGATELAELWVRDPAAASWIDGSSAGYTQIPGTPMDYGFVAAPGDGGMPLSSVWAALIEMEDERRNARR
jgi:copper chaperone NosL